MLSRGSSTRASADTTQLRRAKSTSSTNARTSDPFVTRQQAEAAALEAYYRAEQAREANARVAFEARPKLERRRSRASGRTEGGRFEDARLGRRQSGNTKTKSSRVVGDGKLKIDVVPPTPDAGSMLGAGDREGERIVTRKRSVIPPMPRYTATTADGLTSSMPGDEKKEKRISRSGYTDGSPLPRGLKERSSASRMEATFTEMSDVAGYSIATNPRQHVFEDSQPTRKTPRRSGRDSTVDQDIVAQARDKCLQDFQQKSLRERTSMMLAPFQKRKVANTQDGKMGGFDSSLPPFNYAGEGMDLLLSSSPPPPPNAQPIYAVASQEKKSRNFTASLKGRIKQAFRKTSRVPSGMPAQQVQGKTFHFTTTTPTSSTSDVMPAKEEDPFNGYLAVPDVRTSSAVSKHTTNWTAKSRITSWSNSTVTGTWSTRSELQVDGPPDEHGRLKRSDSVSTLRKATSFLGRPITNKLRKSSRAQLQSSEESTGLYSALQERIRPSESASQVMKADAVDRRTSSALATLPSQQHQHMTNTSAHRRSTQTIRSVTPDPTAYKLDIMSPVTEVMSPEIRPQDPDDETPKASIHTSTPSSQLQRRPAIKAPTPTNEQIARRIERSMNRWKGPLDEMSPAILPRSSRTAMMHDNPYELRSLSRSLHQAPAASDSLPHHARVTTEIANRAENVLSPSLYSRATDGTSPRPDTPVEQGGTVITFTGREVRSYSISPKKQEEKVEKPVKASNEWRRWLSGEWKDLSKTAALDEIALPSMVLRGLRASSAEAEADIPTQSHEAEGRKISSSPPVAAQPLEPLPKRPRPRSSRSSFMNERYPMIDSIRNSIDTRKVSSRAISRPSSVEPGLQLATAVAQTHDQPAHVAEPRPASVIHRPRVVSKYQSVLELGAAARRQGAGTNKAAVSTSAQGPTSAQQPSTLKPSNRPKSAFDLRANYRNRTNGQITSIAINRQSQPSPNYTRSSPIHILEDTTIQNISAGPYARLSTPTNSAPHDPSNKENSTPPPLETLNNLPTVSSSEWLAADKPKLSKTRLRPETVHPALRNRSVSRYSPVRVSNGGEAVMMGGSSPGQKMVTSWLDGKRSKENSPAFV